MLHTPWKTGTVVFYPRYIHNPFSIRSYLYIPTYVFSEYETEIKSLEHELRKARRELRGLELDYRKEFNLSLVGLQIVSQNRLVFEFVLSKLESQNSKYMQAVQEFEDIVQKQKSALTERDSEISKLKKLLI